MSRDTDTTDGDDTPPTDPDRSRRRGFDRRLLSDLSVNVVPIAIIAVFTLLFVVAWPTEGIGDSVLLFHGGLVGGVVVVSVVAGWAITRKRAPLEGSAARNYDDESETG